MDEEEIARGREALASLLASVYAYTRGEVTLEERMDVDADWLRVREFMSNLMAEK